MSLQNMQAEFVALLDEDETSDQITPSRNMCIYTNTVHANLVNALTDIYPLMVKLLGKDFFYMVAHHYIQVYPARSSNLNEYGQYFASFLQQYQPTKHLLYLPEVAEFEWLCQQLYFAPRAEAMPINDFVAIEPLAYKHLYLNLHPALRLKQFVFPILKIISLCENQNDVILDLDEAHDITYLKIIRRELDIIYQTLAADEFHFLAAIDANQSVQQALQQAYRYNHHFAFEEKMLTWITDKTIVNYSLQQAL